MKRTILLIILAVLFTLSSIRIYELTLWRDYYSAERDYYYSQFVQTDKQLTDVTLESWALIMELTLKIIALESDVERLNNLPPVEIIKYVERSVTFKRFTRDGLTAWLKSYDFRAFGGVPFDKIDCDDFAESMQVQAYYDGYLLSLQLVNNNRHMGILAMLENGDIYYIEPITKTVQIVAIRD